MKKKDSKFKINKDNFIQFLANSSPEEINEFIKEKGKPMKIIEPIVFFDKEDKKVNDKL